VTAAATAATQWWAGAALRPLRRGWTSESAADRVARGLVGQVQEEHRASPAAVEEAELVARLREGDERAFESLVESHHGRMIAVALNYVKTRDVAEEVVQEAWLGVLTGLDRFEGRSSLKTWILRILVNTAATRGGREARSLPFSSLAPAGEESPAVEPERFRPPGGAFAGHWNGYPRDWTSLPEEALSGRETLAVVQRAIAELPEAQRSVITMRDIAGCSADEVCETLEVSPGNQRVLLHRARSHVRAALERHLDD
jgi:RNA polymerase sigma-70 factor (ECF subfamily)